MLLTAEEYGMLPDIGRPSELVRGNVVEKDIPYPRYGQICSAILHALFSVAADYDIGRVVARSGVVTQRNPDSVRGADAAFYSFARVGRGQLPNRYLDCPPEVVFVVSQPADAWSDLLGKTAEFLNVGVEVVGLLDTDNDMILVMRKGQPSLKLGPDDELTLPEMHESFRVPGRQFFE